MYDSFIMFFGTNRIAILFTSYLLLFIFLSSFILINKPNHMQQNIPLDVLHAGDFKELLVQELSHTTLFSGRKF